MPTALVPAEAAAVTVAVEATAVVTTLERTPATVVTALEGTAAPVVTTEAAALTAVAPVRPVVPAEAATVTVEGTTPTVPVTVTVAVPVEPAAVVTTLERTPATVTVPVEGPATPVTVEGPVTVGVPVTPGSAALLALDVLRGRLLRHRHLGTGRNLRGLPGRLRLLAALARDPRQQPVGLLAQLVRPPLCPLQLLGELGDLALGLLRGIAHRLGLDLGHRPGPGDLGDLRVEGAGALDDVARGVDARVLHQPEDLPPLVRERQRHDRARAAGTRRTARAVQVVLVVAGRVHVQHQVDAVDVDAAGRDVGRDEDVDVPVLEVGQGPRPRALGHAAVQRVGLHTGVAQLLGDTVGAQLGADEDDRAALAGGDGRGDRCLVLGLHDEDVVRHGRHGALRGVDLVADRVVQVPVDQGLDLVLHGRGEQHPLAARRDLVEQLGDLGHEAQVGHLVGLVENGDLHVLQGAGAAVDDVAQPARGGDQDVDALLQGVDLVAHGRTAADDLHLQAEDVAVRLERVGDLHGELTGRREDDGARLVLLGPAAGERGQGRQTERQGLAGAGAAPAEDVLAGQGVRDGRGLDREGGGHAVLRELAHDTLGQTKVGEGGLGSVFDGLVLGHDDVISTGDGHANAKPSGVSSRHAPVNSVIRDSQYDRLYAVHHGKGEYAPHGALCGGAGQDGIKRSATIRTPSPARQTGLVRLSP